MDCCCSARNNVFINGLFSSKTNSSRRLKPLLVWSCGRRASTNSLVLKAARLLGPGTNFEASKLKVVFLGEEMAKQPRITPRIYTVTHCDLTANLTLAISNTINVEQLRGWYNRLQRDDVIAEWRKVKDEMSLHVHCHVSGAHLLLDLAAEFRYHIFTKELPLVLKALIHGDSVLFNGHPELLEATVWVYFHSNSKNYDRVECWGALKDAAQGIFGAAQLDEKGPKEWTIQNQLDEKGPKEWAIHKSFFHALVAILL
ncbi:magnesium dechelatase SGRL, chloroplastic-like isoform X2 [Tasmannia lanceolata]|uniref:magnesium dechelatase SGRL, chloroplastic-like isoform X2 n=1 Tax=Tasmannia lanceolata TaxID=3420 RepID=UPI0040633B9E